MRLQQQDLLQRLLPARLQGGQVPRWQMRLRQPARHTRHRDAEVGQRRRGASPKRQGNT
jgi:hypothetical protein